MPNLKCLGCGREIELDARTYANYQGDITCEHCQSMQSVKIRLGELKAVGITKNKMLSQGLHKGIPDGILADWYEAFQDLGFKSYKSSAVLSRRALQGALLDKGVPDGTPVNMIKDAVKKGILNRDLEQLTLTVPFFGAWGAHPKDTELEGAGELEATQGLVVTKRILLYLYPVPRAYDPAPVGGYF